MNDKVMVFIWFDGSDEVAVHEAVSVEDGLVAGLRYLELVPGCYDRLTVMERIDMSDLGLRSRVITVFAVDASVRIDGITGGWELLHDRRKEVQDLKLARAAAMKLAGL